jgi:MFS family permease
MDNANRMFQKRFCFTQVGAGKAIMLTYLVCVVVSPPIGIAVDKIGLRRYWIVGTALVYFCAHFIFLVYPSCLGNVEKGSISGLVLVGVGYALYSNCLVPVIPIIVKESITGTAFGLMAMV